MKASQEFVTPLLAKQCGSFRGFVVTVPTENRSLSASLAVTSTDVADEQNLSRKEPEA